MEKHSLETWYALADADPQGTFNKLVKSLDISFSTAEIILSDNHNNYIDACKYLIVKYQGEIKKTEPITPSSSIPKNNNAGWSLFLGIFSLIAWIYPLCGFPVSIFGLILGIKSINSQNRNLAVAGTIISTIGLIITTANSAIGAYLGYTGQLFTSPNVSITSQIPNTPPNFLITNTPSTFSNCVKWSEITIQMEGRQVCVYGTVQNIYSTNETWTRIKFTDQPNTFFIYDIQNIYTDLNVGDCLLATSTVKLHGNIPYMEVAGELLYCESWMVNQ